MVGDATEAIYQRYAIQDEAMLREASAGRGEWPPPAPPPLSQPSVGEFEDDFD